MPFPVITDETNQRIEALMHRVLLVEEDYSRVQKFIFNIFDLNDLDAEILKNAIDK